MDLISLLVFVVVLGLVFWMGVWIINQLPLPQPFHGIALALLGLIILLILLILLAQTGIIGGAAFHRPLL